MALSNVLRSVPYENSVASVRPVIDTFLELNPTSEQKARFKTALQALTLACVNDGKAAMRSTQQRLSTLRKIHSELLEVVE